MNFEKKIKRNDFRYFFIDSGLNQKLVPDFNICQFKFHSRCMVEIRLKLGFKLNKIRVQSVIKETLQDSKFSVVLDSVYGARF